jgi:2-amino-4-hydroxy-6-hydroxymethyldihydropteridine diphosphokinase
MQTAYIAMGANLASWVGAPEATLTAAATRLESLGRVARRSSLYSTEPVGFAEQPRFVNAVVALETEIAPQELLNGLLAIEQEFGRDRAAGIHNGPRTLDLDILLFGDMKVSEPGLEIPHPRLAQRAFVLVPLNEIAPDIRQAGIGLVVSQLLNSFHKSAKSTADAVVPIEYDGWRPGAGGDGDCPGGV